MNWRLASEKVKTSFGSKGGLFHIWWWMLNSQYLLLQLRYVWTRENMRAHKKSLFAELFSWSRFYISKRSNLWNVLHCETCIQIFLSTLIPNWHCLVSPMTCITSVTFVTFMKDKVLPAFNVLRHVLPPLLNVWLQVGDSRVQSSTI